MGKSSRRDRDLTQAPTDVYLEVDASTFRLKARGFGMRLDKFLAHHLKWRSRARCRPLLRDGYVSVDASRPDAPPGHRRTEG